MTTPGEPCRTCDGTGYVETAPPDSRVIHHEPCPQCGGPPPAPVPGPLIAALVGEYASILARTHPVLVDRWSWLSPVAYVGYERGRREALLSMARRLGLHDLHERAAALVARGQNEEGP